MKSFEEDASKIGLRPHLVSVRSEDEFEDALSSMKQAGISAFVGVGSPLFFNRRVRLPQLALKHRLGGIFSARGMVEAGALMSYGANGEDLSRRAADYVDKILRGAKSADLPVEQASNYELVSNLKSTQRSWV